MLHIKLLLLILASIPLWALMFVLELFLMASGWVIVPVAVTLGRYEVYGQNHNGPLYRFSDKWVDLIFGNWEDGIYSGLQYKNLGSIPLQIIYWSCLRNPINGMRAIQPFAVFVEKERVHYFGEPFVSPSEFDRKGIDGRYPDQWFFARQGLYTGFYLVRQFPLLGRRRLWLGWKLFPKNSVVGATPYQSKGVSFTTQFRRLD
jgi:hypothetical protein